MKAVFIADAHLKHAGDEGYRDLMHFLDIIPHVDRLFIVGDFFDFWFCRGERVYPEYLPIIDKLVHLKKNGMHIAFFEGNHDFHMEDYFSDRLGMAVFVEWNGIHLDDRTVFLSHGDTVDRANHKYLFIRKVFRSRTFYHVQRIIPLALLWKLARLCSVASKELSAESQNMIAAKMEIFSQRKFQEGFDAVILGHCHKPIIKEYVVEGRTRTFATLGDWVKHRSYLYYEDGRFMLKYFSETVTP